MKRTICDTCSRVCSKADRIRGMACKDYRKRERNEEVQNQRKKHCVVCE